MFEEILKRLDNFELLLKFNKTFLALDEAVLLPAAIEKPRI